MALTSFSNRGAPSAEEGKLIDFLLDCPYLETSLYKELEHPPYFNNEATRLFRLAATDCRKGFTERAAAHAELKALDATP
jgi:hypothetical protein